MNKNTYMSKNEMISFLKIGILAGEAAAVAEKTNVKEWRRKLKTVSTMCSNIVIERLMALDKKQLVSVERRKDHTEIMLFTSDQRRIDKDDEGLDEEITVIARDLEDLAALALCSCRNCKQNDISNCKYRTVMHRLGLEVARTNVKENQCEFKPDDKVLHIEP